MSAKDSSLYGLKRHKLSSDKEIASSNSLAFSSQLSSLINTSAPTSSRSTSKTNPKPRKDDIFTSHNRAKKLKRGHKPSGAFEQVHTTDGESLDSDAWNRSKRKMEEKARLYAAMKRGDIEDADEKYAVDFDKKWAEREGEDSEVSDEEDARSEEGDADELVEYVDELGRTRKGTRKEADKAARLVRLEEERGGNVDRFTARPAAPTNVIYGDTIQSAAFNPDAPIAEQMAELAKKRDRSMTPPEEHFDSRKEVRTKGTGFFQFSEDVEERKKQMEGLEREREETERMRAERQKRVEERRKQVEERRREVREKRGRKQADDFLDKLGEEIAGRAGGDGAESEDGGGDAGSNS